MNKKTLQRWTVGLITAVLAVVGIGRVISGNVYVAETSGTAEQWVVYDLQNKQYAGVWVNCSYCEIRNVNVFESPSHGIRIGYTGIPVHHVIIDGFSVAESVTEHRPASSSGSWGSCVKAWTNATDFVIRNGTVKRCYGEAVGITGSQRVLIENVTVENGWGGGYYIDNARWVELRNSVAVCNDPAFYRNGKPSASILLGDERYDSLGLNTSQLGDLSIHNNVSYGCGSLQYWGGHFAPNGGVAGATIANNIFYDAPVRAIWFASGSRNANIAQSGNQFLTSAGGPTMTPTPTRTATASRTPTVVPLTLTRTPTPVISTPTATPGCLEIYRNAGVVILACPTVQP